MPTADPTITMLPASPLDSQGTAARVSAAVLRRFDSTTRHHSSGSRRVSLPPFHTAALRTSESSRPQRVAAASTTASAVSGAARSKYNGSNRSGSASASSVER